MKIVAFRAENFKRLQVVEITPAGHVVQITGANGNGKSSVLDAIYAALGGKDAAPSQPIRRGQESAVVRLDLGEFVVTRKFTKAGTTAVVVEAPNGARFPTPQKLLDDLVGSLAFDPLAFSRAEPRRQLELLREVVPVSVDLDQLDGLNARDYEARADLNKRAASLRAQADGIAVPEDLPAHEVDVTGLLGKMEHAATHNASIITRQAKRKALQEEIERERRQVDFAVAQATELRRQASAMDDHAQKMREALQAKAERLLGAAPLPEPVDVADLSAKVEKAHAVNAQLATRLRRDALITDAGNISQQADALTDAMTARKKIRDDAIAAAQMPVDGLDFGDGEVLYQELPFSQASDAMRLRISVAIAMASNPKLRISIIRDGSLLDSKSLGMLRELAVEHDFQIWIEQVDETGKVGVVLEAGTVVADHQRADAEAVTS